MMGLLVITVQRSSSPTAAQESGFVLLILPLNHKIGGKALEKTLKRSLLTSLFLIMLVILLPTSTFASHPESPGFSKPNGNTYLISTVSEFAAGTGNGIAIHQHPGNGVISLAKSNGRYPAEGTFLSPAIPTAAFDYMVASWNSDTPKGTYVEIQARALISHYDAAHQLVQDWSAWHSWGKWGTYIARASVSDNSDPLAFVDTDTFTVKGNSGETADKIQLKATLHTDNPKVTPDLRLLGASMEHGWNAYIKNPSKISLDKDIPTPAYSQMIRDPKLAPNICSPTTITMAMNRMGENLLLEEAAYKDYDYTYDGFGNWAFSTALAGSYGYKAYTEFTDIDGLKQQIASGYPVGVSVRYTNNPNNKSLPYVENAPGTTYGHLILVRGFETVDGQDYVVVNDSFAPSDATATRRYKLDQFEKAWVSSIAYVVHDKEPGAAIGAAKRIKAALRPAGPDNEYTLDAGKNRVALPHSFTANVDPLTTQSGTIAYTLSEGKKFPTTAAQKFYYTHETLDGNIYLDMKKIASGLNGRIATLTLYVMSTENRTYMAQLKLNEQMFRGLVGD